jgi:hypothetical protein
MHLFLHCNFASQCWNLLGISITQAPQFCFYPQDEVAVAVFHGGGHSHVLVNLEFKKWPYLQKYQTSGASVQRKFHQWDKVSCAQSQTKSPSKLWIMVAKSYCFLIDCCISIFFCLLLCSLALSASLACHLFFVTDPPFFISINLPVGATAPPVPLKNNYMNDPDTRRRRCKWLVLPEPIEGAGVQPPLYASSPPGPPMNVRTSPDPVMSRSRTYSRYMQ